MPRLGVGAQRARTGESGDVAEFVDPVGAQVAHQVVHDVGDGLIPARQVAIVEARIRDIRQVPFGMVTLQRLVAVLDEVGHVARDLEAVTFGIARLGHHPAADLAVAGSGGTAFFGFGHAPVIAVGIGPRMAVVAVFRALAIGPRRLDITARAADDHAIAGLFGLIGAASSLIGSRTFGAGACVVAAFACVQIDEPESGRRHAATRLPFQRCADRSCTSQRYASNQMSGSLKSPDERLLPSRRIRSLFVTSRVELPLAPSTTTLPPTL